MIEPKFRDIALPPLTEINEQGALNLMEALYVQAAQDYLKAKRFLQKHPSSLEAEITIEECSKFLGRNIVDTLERNWAKGITATYHRRK